MLEQLQANIHYTFRQVKFLLSALTHSSYSNEAPQAGGHNERLEFLGDAVLELCISELLYHNFVEAREGELTFMRSRLVSQPALAALAREIKLDEHLLLGRGEEVQGGRTRDALLSDAFEAVLGAVFLDGGFDEARRVIAALFLPGLRAARSALPDKDYKSSLQELTQKIFQDRPVYVLRGSSGPEHAKRFEVALTLPDGRSYVAEGSSVKKAEQAVAALAAASLRGEV
ncbi:MAG: ribonuclease III [Deltaproteobacteria bacterium]|jgi:ribonuclease-3|nr:ribonuclease III [Deltaproteobacteria bacterium]